MLCPEYSIFLPAAFSDASQDGFFLNFQTDGSVPRSGFRLEFTLSKSIHIGREQNVDCMFDHQYNSILIQYNDRLFTRKTCPLLVASVSYNLDGQDYDMDLQTNVVYCWCCCGGRILISFC